MTGTLEAVATRFLKRWSGLAKAADTARLYIPRSQGGLNLLPISLLYRKHQVSQACQLLASTDPIVRFTTSVKIKREEAQQRVSFKLTLTARDILAEDPGMSKKALLNKAKSVVSKRDTQKRVHHAKSLKCQEQVFRCCDEGPATIWATAIQQLAPDFLKFSLNVVQDTLPHNDNLARWRRSEGLSSNCKLCGERHHVLNHCSRALELRKCNERHDAVLDSRPDIVVWNNNIKEVWVIKFTVCYETRVDEAHNRKMARYSDLTEGISASSWDGCLVALEVGSRGFLSLPRFTMNYCNAVKENGKGSWLRQCAQQ